MLSDYDHQALSVMAQAFMTASLSNARRRKTGAIFLRQLSGNYFQPVSSGYNGTRPGENNACEDLLGISLGRNVVHAEQNSLIKMMTQGVATEGTTAVITFVPCDNCCEALIDARVKEVIYCYDSDSDDKKNSVKKLSKAGIHVSRIDQVKVYHYMGMVMNGLTQNKFMGEPVEQEYHDMVKLMESKSRGEIMQIADNIALTYDDRYSGHEEPQVIYNYVAGRIDNVKSFLEWFNYIWLDIQEVEYALKRSGEESFHSLPQIIEVYFNRDY